MVNAGLQGRQPGPMSRALGAYKAGPAPRGPDCASNSHRLPGEPSHQPPQAGLSPPSLLLLPCSTGSQVRDLTAADQFQAHLQRTAEGGEHEKGLPDPRWLREAPPVTQVSLTPHCGFWGLPTAAALWLKWQDVPQGEQLRRPCSRQGPGGGCCRSCAFYPVQPSARMCLT